MLKPASFAWIVAVGIFLIVAAASGIEDSVTNSYDETSEPVFTEETITATRNKHDKKESTGVSLINTLDEPSEANFTEEAENSTKVTNEDEDEKKRKFSESLVNEEDGIKLSRVPKQRKFETDGETAEQSKEPLDEALRNDSIRADRGRTESKALSDPAGPSEQSNTSCGAPPEIEGTITSVLEGTEHGVGTNISYQCDFGYVSRGSGSFLSTCKFDERTRTARWSKPDVSCVSRSCGDPGYVANARRVGNLFTFPNRVEFHCEDGYKLRGLKARYCQANGDWSGRLPSCEKVYCRVPTDPVNGRVLYSSLEYGTELRYECGKGFALSHHEPRICANDGTWSNNAPECIEARCKIPESPVHGSVQLLGEPRVGSLALYFCEEDTTLIGSSTSKCLNSGDWTFDPPKCMRSCKITDIKDGEIGRNERVRISKYSSRTTLQFSKFHAGASIKHNETVTLQCNRGFSPVNSSVGSREVSASAEVTCTDGFWNKPMLCEASPCLGSPPPVDNASPVIEDNRHGKVIWYRCNPDFTRAKPGKIECDHGTWKGNTPVCADTRCPLAQLDFPGLLKPEGEFLKSRSYFQIACARGYKKKGSKEKIRCANGGWDISRNPCKIETCDDDPPPVMNGISLQFSREHGSLIRYECNEHFDLVGTSSVQCDAGKWKGQPPTCQESVTSVATSTMRYAFGFTPESLNVFPSSNPADLCSCTFDFESPYVAAMVNDRTLHPRQEVEKGGIVIFSCLHGANLQWQNGLVISGTANLICSECRNWLQHELPTCTNQPTGYSAILYNDKMTIQPGGSIEINKDDRFEITCINVWLQPKWYPSTTSGMSFTQDSYLLRRATGYYGANMHIEVASDEHIGRHECFALHNEVAYKPTVFELRIADREKQCPVLNENTKTGAFSITYENDRKVNSLAYYICKDSSQKLIGTDNRRCLESGRWSGSFPSCADITCWKHTTYNGLEVSYTNSNKVNSIAKFRCADPRILVGINSTVCQHDGTWRDSKPRCEMLDIRCPQLDKKGIFSIHYSNYRRINSTAQFYCVDRYQRVEGCSVMTCQQNGEWSGTYPSCVDYVNCTRFQDSPPLEVSYSDGVRVGSVASFHCQPPRTLIGSPSATCHFNGTWSHPPPLCETPNCSIDDLFSSLPEGIVADLSEMTDAYVESVPYGTEMRLLCEEGLIRIGNSKATCESLKWEYGNVQCVPGCRLNSDDPTHLLIDPAKEYYRFGDFVLLSCPPGQKLTSDVERVMCLGKSWSDDLPGCIEITETSTSTLRERRKSA